MRQRVWLAALLVLMASVRAPAVLARQSDQAPAFPQPSQPLSRPFRPLFGGSATDPRSHEALSITFSTEGGYDDNAYAQAGVTPIDPTTQVGGSYAALQAELDYVKRGRHLSFDARAGSLYRYYPDLTGLNGATPWVSLGLSGSLSRHTRLAVNGGAAYSPYYSFGVFPGLASSETPGQSAAARVDRALFRQPSYLYTAGANLEHQFSPRSTFTADYALRYTDFRDQPTTLRDQLVGVGLGRDFTRALGFHLRYAYHDGDYGYPGSVSVPFKTHDLDAGLEYNKGGPDLAGRTTLGFRVGPTIIVAPPDNFYRVLGTVYLSRAFGRSWNLRADYRRGLQFVEGFARPFFADSVSVSARGFIGTRLELFGWGGYSNGELGLSTLAQTFDTYTGNVGVRIGLAQYLALDANYLFYHYLFDRGSPLPPGVAQGLDRNAVRAGFTVWLPLLR